MISLKPKISIIGCGNVGMRYAYALIIRGLARQLVLVDMDPRRAEGEAMDLSHGAPYVSPVDVIAGGYPETRDSDIVVITAGKKQKPGQTRQDLVKDNVEIFRSIIPEIVKHSPSAILLIASNPVDVMAYAAWKFSGKPAHEVIGSGTVLDSARFRFELAKHCVIDPHNIHAYILGEHGDSEFAAWSKVMIGGSLFSEYCVVCKNNHTCSHPGDLEKIFQDVRNSAYEIIERKGETSYGIGLALVRITRAILNNENAILPVSSLVENYAGINNVYLSLPAVVNLSGVREVFKLTLSTQEELALQNSAATIQSVIQHITF
ncbi:MAG: L-lactate dehydrogenase [Endomicrobiales bacterium]|jgi:L-lactate dehydrogenase